MPRSAVATRLSSASTRRNRSRTSSPTRRRASSRWFPKLKCPGIQEPRSLPIPNSDARLSIRPSAFCPKQETFTFLENVLSEVITLFPGPYVHIGSDEVEKEGWRQSPEAQAIIKREGLKDEDELQSYFARRIEQFLDSRGKRMIGWDEILQGGLAPRAIVMSWRGEERGHRGRAARITKSS